MRRRRALAGVIAFGVAIGAAPWVGAQPGARGIVVGLLDAGERPEWWNAFRQRFAELGYVEGRNVRFEQRYAKGDSEALAMMARQLVQMKVAIIVTSGGAAAVAAQRATAAIPIVMASGADQVGLGLAASLARPGGNVTGVSSFTPDLMAKRLELLHEVVPKSVRIAALWHADNAPSMASVRELDGAAARAKLGFLSYGIRSSDELADVFTAMSRERVNALVVVNSPLLFSERRRICELARKHKLPSIYGSVEYVETGGLMSYGPSYPELFRHAAVYADKILKGAKPGEMPIEQPATFDLVLNAGTAHALGIVFPPSMQARAYRVVD